MSLFLDSPLICPVIIGRTTYLAALNEYLNTLAGGRGHILTVRGEAGVGKTRLVTEARKRAAQIGWQSCQGQCYEYQRLLPFGPLIDLLWSIETSQLAGYLARSGNSRLSGVVRRLSRLVPELIINDHSEAASSPDTDPEQERYLLFKALTDLFVHLASEQPLLLIFEDLHWCDETSLEFLLYLTRRITTQPLLILLTYRAEEVNSALGHFLAELNRTRLMTEMALAPFSPVETGQMLQAILELPQPVRNNFLTPIYDLSEGNPFFIEEILRSLIANGEIYRENGLWEGIPIGEMHIPSTIQVAIQRRCLHLSPPAREVLHLAAIIGRRFDFNLLLKLSDQPEPALITQLKELMAVQLLKEEANGQVAFRHALARQAIYAELLGPERKALHLKTGQAIEQIFIGKLEEHLAELAYHFYQAGEWQKAYDYSLRVGEKALALHAPGAVIENLSQALEIAGHLNKLPPAWLYRTRGQAYELKGNFEAAQADFTQALGLARQGGDALAEWQSLLDLGFLWAGHNYERAGEIFQQALELAQRLNNPLLEARSLNRLGNWRANTGQLEESLTTHYEALAIFERLEDKKGMAETQDLLGLTNGLYGDVTKAAAHSKKAVTLLRELGEERLLISSLSELALCTSHHPLLDLVMVEAGLPKSFEQACSYLDEALQLARRHDWLADQAYILMNFSGLAGFYGELGTALNYVQQALQIATEIEHRQWTASTHYLSGVTYSHLLQFELAQSHLEEGLALATELGSVYWAGNIVVDLSLLYLQQNNLTQAEKALTDYRLSDKLPRNQGERRLAMAWGWLALTQGLPQTSLQLVNQIIASFPKPALEQPGPQLLHLKAEALMALGHSEMALTTFTEAKTLIQDWQALPILWQLQRRMSLLYAQLKQTEAARREAEAARQTIKQIAAKIEDSALRDNFVTAALATLPTEKPLSTRRTSRLEYDGLTAREREVAAQIALGKSNREIAQILTLSERTIEAHVGRILAKLEFCSRSQIAVWAVGKGLSAN